MLRNKYAARASLGTGRLACREKSPANGDKQRGRAAIHPARTKVAMRRQPHGHKHGRKWWEAFRGVAVPPES